MDEVWAPHTHAEFRGASFPWKIDAFFVWPTRELGQVAEVPGTRAVPEVGRGLSVVRNGFVRDSGGSWSRKGLPSGVLLR